MVNWIVQNISGFFFWLFLHWTCVYLGKTELFEIDLFFDIEPVYLC